MNQKKTIDYLKAFAIVMVVFYHAIISLDICYHDIIYICITIALKNIHVPLFLLIAGYLCHKQDVRTFYIKKVRRILIPFLFMSAMKLLFNNILGTEFVHGESIPQQIYDAFICGQLYWFCYGVLIMFLIAPLLWNRKSLQWVLLGLTVAANMVLVLNDISLTNVLQLNNVLFYSPFFLTGMLLSEYHFSGWTKRTHILCLIAAFLIGAVTGYLRFHEDIHQIYAVDLLFGLSVMCILYHIAKRIPDHGIPSKCLYTVGRYSLQVMMLDPFLRFPINLLLGMIMPAGTVMAVLSTFLNVGFSCLICIVAEKIPILSTLMGLGQLKRN